MKVFVISIPKSGTYLIREILEQFGFDRSYLHISETGTYDYSKISFDESRRNPQQCLSKMPLEKSLKNVPQNSFAVGHLKYSMTTAELLKDFNVIFIGRDVKETILSYMIYGLETGRALRNEADQIWISEENPQEQFLKYIELRGDKILKTYSKILPWREHNIECFDFNKLKSNPVEQTQRLAHVVQFNFSDTEIKQIIDSSFEKKTLTSSSKNTNKTKYWSETAHQQIDMLIKKHKIEYR